jgi:hypothetical protein
LKEKFLRHLTFSCYYSEDGLRSKCESERENISHQISASDFERNFFSQVLPTLSKVSSLQLPRKSSAIIILYQTLSRQIPADCTFLDCAIDREYQIFSRENKKFFSTFQKLLNEGKSKWTSLKNCNRKRWASFLRFDPEVIS